MSRPNTIYDDDYDKHIVLPVYSGVMLCLSSFAKELQINSRSDQTKPWTIIICFFSTTPATLTSKSKYW